MKTSRILSAALAALFIANIAITTPAHALGTIVVFTINGVLAKQGISPLNIEGTYTVNGIQITIAPYGGNALIEYNETGDWLRMKNAEITSPSAPIDNVKFSFWRTFDSLNVNPLPVTYSVSGSGFFSRSTISTDPINWISLRGYVETTVLGSPALSSPPPFNPPNCTLSLTACATYQPATWTFNLNVPNGGFKVSHTFTTTSPPPPSADDLKAEFWIHLQKTTDRLDITAAPGIRVKYGPPMGEGAPGVCPPDPVPVMGIGFIDLGILNIHAFDYFTPCIPVDKTVSCDEPIFPGSKRRPLEKVQPEEKVTPNLKP